MKQEYKVTSDFYDRIHFCIHTAGCGCYVYAFFAVLYWFLNIFNLNWVASMAFLFEPVFDITRSVYRQPAFMPSDMSGIVTCLVFFIFGIIFQTLADRVNRLKEAALLKLEQKFLEEDKQQQQAIRQEYYKEMKKYDKVVVLVEFNIQPIKSVVFDDEIDQDELRGIKISIMSELFHLIKGNYITQKAKYKNDCFYVICPIKNTPECTQLIISSIKNLSRKYSNMNITLSHDLSFDAISDSEIKFLDKKLDVLEKIIQLDYNNITLTTAKFKTCYELISKASLQFTVMGKFQLKTSNNEAVNCELYSVKNY